MMSLLRVASASSFRISTVRDIIVEDKYEDNCTGGPVPVIAFAAFVSIASSAAQEGPIVPAGRYCLAYDHGGSDCSFTSYAQCQATASGIDAECTAKPFRMTRIHETRAVMATIMVTIREPRFANAQFLMIAKCDTERASFVIFRGSRSIAYAGSKLRSQNHSHGNCHRRIPLEEHNGTTPVEGRPRVGIKHNSVAGQLYP